MIVLLEIRFLCTFAAVKQVKVYNIVSLDGYAVKRN